MIKIRNILTTFRDLLLNSSELSNWCSTNYGAEPKIFVGMDKQNPPGKKDAPFVMIRPGAANEGQEVDNFGYKIQVDWALSDDSREENGRAIEYTGQYKLDEMGNLVWDALVAGMDNVTLSSSEYTLEPIEFFPLLVGGMDIDINVPNTIGGEITI